MQAYGRTRRGVVVAQLTCDGECVAVGGSREGKAPGQAAGVGHGQEKAETGATIETGEVGERECPLEQSDGFFERQALGRVGGRLPRVAHRRVAGIGVSAGGGGQEVGGKLGRVHHGAFGSGRFERGTQIAVQAAAHRSR